MGAPELEDQNKAGAMSAARTKKLPLPTFWEG
jgi:hypothetical protein